MKAKKILALFLILAMLASMSAVFALNVYAEDESEEPSADPAAEQEQTDESQDANEAQDAEEVQDANEAQDDASETEDEAQTQEPETPTTAIVIDFSSYEDIDEIAMAMAADGEYSLVADGTRFVLLAECIAGYDPADDPDGKSTAGDPNIQLVGFADLGVDATTYKWMKMSLKNESEAPGFEVHYASPTKGLSVETSITFDIDPESGYKNYVYNVPEAGEKYYPKRPENVEDPDVYPDHWNGLISTFRLDFMYYEESGGHARTGDKLYIEYIAFFESEQEALNFVFVPVNGESTTAADEAALAAEWAALMELFEGYADDLKTLGLFLGTDSGYELERVPTRAEAATLLVRLLGAEAEAKAENYAHPFTDVPEWADPYVGFLYEYGMTLGIGDNLFGSGDACTAQMFGTFVLRALGYSDIGEDADFTYSEALEFADELGLLGTSGYDSKFIRGNCAEMMYFALLANMKGTRMPLIQWLLLTGAVDEAAVMEVFSDLLSPESEAAMELIGELTETLMAGFLDGSLISNVEVTDLLALVSLIDADSIKGISVSFGTDIDGYIFKINVQNEVIEATIAINYDSKDNFVGLSAVGTKVDEEAEDGFVAFEIAITSTASEEEAETPVVTEIVAKWTFSEDDPVFKAGNQIEDLRIEGNILKLTSIGGDPFMYSINDDLGMSAEDVDFIKIMVKNGSAVYGCQIFFITNDNGGYSEDMSLRGAYVYADGEDWEEYTFATADCELWEGTIKAIRFDPMTAEGEFEMEYMSFEKIAG
ncbi:MAG: hypothetical protein FWH48_08055 [Oscillospiraceae bacterium]|nr:hypothetical protein [Oscillospiraceae bacterium]